MKSEIDAKLLVLDYWHNLNIVVDSSSPNYALCSQNDIVRFLMNYVELLNDTQVRKVDIITTYYNRDHYTDDEAFGC